MGIELYNSKDTTDKLFPKENFWKILHEKESEKSKLYCTYTMQPLQQSAVFKALGCDHCTKDHIFFSQMLWKDSLSKKITLEYNLSCIVTKDGISFSRKYDVIL